MEKVDRKIRAYSQVITFLVVWFVVVILTNSYSTTDLLPAIKRIPLAISIYVILASIFVKWIWRWKIFQGWLIKVPDLQGTWEGELKSDWINPETGKGIDPIPMLLVIKQTFTSINCTLMTKESTSYSTTADFEYVHGGDAVYLTYNYTNRPKATIRDRSAIHDGAAILKVIKDPERRLEGEYWTSRKTRGDISIHFGSKDLAERF
ncbi:MAG: hypothetical protein COV59_03515 [Candidatus Magasanikbacteria bacterium CG11_big_fil_rev_8_21_14_0_20_39_34]|uniref:CD-NTase-associated protein 15 domain-containing protein n=1 Tax=Candidatus Magasanikbacteria bacterium CG11_big_fil_rev_8_21_14_0_20_39_34 TaxID=1974653 RepID=A0A2H0N5P9_9BACT|nr:MAG: hypothetical protein COV59_03515 [Candidatus Magasanikbacteria bacterium CG11_big_fil_rev_8_21_14_0_20_39_34]